MQRPPRPCSWPGCPHLTVKAGGCAIHQNTINRQNYRGGWSAFAAAYLSTHPWCAHCAKARAREVHHKISPRVNPSRRCDPTNVVALCHVCHSAQHTPTRATTGQDPRRKR